MEKNILEIGVSEIMEHPLQQTVYGKIQIDDDFVSSIEERGILQPLVICKSSLFNEYDNDSALYICISGHRRLAAAEKLGLETVPCIVKDYNDILETELDLVISNKHRIKTKMQIALETNYLLEIVSKITESKRNTSGLGQDKNNSKLLVENSTNSKLPTEVLEKLEQMEDGNMNALDVVASLLGCTRSEVEQLKVIFNAQYRQKYLEQTKSREENDKLYSDWQGIQEQFESGELSRDAAYKAVRKLCEPYGKKPKKDAKVKKEKVDKVQSMFVIGLGVHGVYYNRGTRMTEVDGKSVQDISIPFGSVSEPPFLESLALIGKTDFCLDGVDFHDENYESIAIEENWQLRLAVEVHRAVAKLLGKKIITVE